MILEKPAILRVWMHSSPIIPAPTTTTDPPIDRGVRFVAWTAMETASIIAACSKGRESGIG